MACEFWTRMEMKCSFGTQVPTMPKDGPDSVEVRSRAGDASCYRANLNPPSWSRQLNEQSALMRALAARPIGPDSVAHG